ncbi:MAG: flavin reductase family protein [Nitrososphaerota archaeon]|nr:flavin reductase family protein [Nitrososphaerota archaeon]
MKVDPSLIHRLFYPQVPLVMAAQHGGRVSAMPVVSYLSVSEEPPMVGVACKPGGFTCKLALKARAFSLSVLDRGHAGALSGLATLSGAQVEDKLSEVGLPHVPGTRAKVPVPKDALAALECRLKSSQKHGDHLLLVARVEAAYSSAAFTDSWDYARYRPILYTGWKEGITLYRGP